MKAFARRRATLTMVTVFAAAGLLAVSHVVSTTLYSGDYVTGWVLLGMIIFLAAYNIRKSIPFLPLGSSAAWLQAHIYCALLTAVVFAVHVDFSIPNGFLESILAGLYVTVFGSGVLGLYISRRYPRRLTALGQEVFFEQIPVHRRRIQENVEELVLKCNSDSGRSAISDFYLIRLKSFLDRPRDFLSHVIFGGSSRWRRIKREIDDQHRYLNSDERIVLDSITELVRRKYELDCQHALQAALKYWFFVHVPLTWALLVFAVFHSMLVHAWSGGHS